MDILQKIKRFERPIKKVFSVTITYEYDSLKRKSAGAYKNLN